MMNMGNASTKTDRKLFPRLSFSVLLIIALGLWLDCVSCAFVACVCFSFIIVSESSTTSSNVGLAISQALILTGMVQYGIRQMMESFQLFTNTERVLQYTKLEQEPLISRKPTKDWPFKGISNRNYFQIDLEFYRFSSLSLSLVFLISLCLAFDSSRFD